MECKAFVESPSRRPMDNNVERCGLHKSGHEFAAEIRLNSMNTDDGRFLVATIRDVTEKLGSGRFARRHCIHRCRSYRSCRGTSRWVDWALSFRDIAEIDDILERPISVSRYRRESSCW